jgi:hypothetical protein
MMHPDMTAALARQRMTEMSDDVDRRRARPQTARTRLRVHVGRSLVRFGDRLARPTSSPSILRHSPSVTMTG